MEYGLLLYILSSVCKTNNVATVFLTVRFWQPQLQFFYTVKITVLFLNKYQLIHYYLLQKLFYKCFIMQFNKKYLFLKHNTFKL